MTTSHLREHATFRDEEEYEDETGKWLRPAGRE